jgi:quinol monooxygenase YgiN
MFARITTLRFRPDTDGQGFDIMEHSIVPSIKEQPGCKGLLLLRDPSTCNATTVTLWDSEAAMAASASGNYPLQLAKLDGLLAEPPRRDKYEVKDISL